MMSKIKELHEMLESEFNTYIELLYEPIEIYKPQDTPIIYKDNDIDTKDELKDNSQKVLRNTILPIKATPNNSIFQRQHRMNSAHKTEVRGQYNQYT